MYIACSEWGIANIQRMVSRGTRRGLFTPSLDHGGKRSIRGGAGQNTLPVISYVDDDFIILSRII